LWREEKPMITVEPEVHKHERNLRLLLEDKWPNLNEADKTLFSTLCGTPAPEKDPKNEYQSDPLLTGRWYRCAFEFDEENSTGVHLWREASFLNHSCLPNCMVFKDEQERLTIVNILPIQGDGVELTIRFFKYQDMLKNCVDRRELLRECAYFHCLCDVCLQHDLTPTNDPDEKKRIEAGGLCNALKLNELGKFETSLTDSRRVQEYQLKVETLLRLLHELRIIDYLGNAYMRAIFLFSLSENLAFSRVKMEQYRTALQAQMLELKDVEQSLLYEPAEYPSFKAMENHNQAMIACSMHKESINVSIKSNITARWKMAEQKYPGWRHNIKKAQRNPRLRAPRPRDDTTTTQVTGPQAHDNEDEEMQNAHEEMENVDEETEDADVEMENAGENTSTRPISTRKRGRALPEAPRRQSRKRGLPESNVTFIPRNYERVQNPPPRMRKQLVEQAPSETEQSAGRRSRSGSDSDGESAEQVKAPNSTNSPIIELARSSRFKKRRVQEKPVQRRRHGIER
jgi:hypothetical protein